ncbi:MAG: TOPRIM nucleotidyl transferase/hydrolase domain-containing protein [Acidimicrobiia bacterium]
MEAGERHRLAQEVLAGYVSGPAAATEATRRALLRVGDAQGVVLVEGISDQIAVETLAIRSGRDLDEAAVVVVPVGGAHGVTAFLERFGPRGADLRLSGMCDEAEETVFRRGLTRSGLGSPVTRADMERLGFFVCVEDLEDELIRAVGAYLTESIMETQGDLGSFRTLQAQPAWRGRDTEAQLRRFVSAGARRKLRYAKLLVEAIPLDRVPRALEGVLSFVLEG